MEPQLIPPGARLCWADSTGSPFIYVLEIQSLDQSRERTYSQFPDDPCWPITGDRQNFGDLPFHARVMAANLQEKTPFSDWSDPMVFPTVPVPEPEVGFGVVCLSIVLVVLGWLRGRRGRRWRASRIGKSPNRSAA